MGGSPWYRRRVLVGRAADLERAEQLLADGRLVAISGPAGIGKTALIRELAHRHPDPAIGQSLPALQHCTYQPILHALGLPPGAATDRAAATQLVLERNEEGALLVLEDLHWSDHGTLEVLAELADLADGRALLVTVRPGTERGDAVLRLTESLGGTVLALDTLDEDTTVELIAARRPDLVPPEHRRLARLAGGVPLMAEILARTGDAGRPSGRSPVEAAVARLGPAARTGLALLALASTPLPAEEVDGGAELVGAHLATVADDGLLVPAHAMFADAAVASLEPGTCEDLHRRLAERPDVDPGRRATHLFHAGDDATAVALALRAATGPVPRSEQAGHLEIAARAALRLGGRTVDGPAGEIELDALRVQAAAALNDCCEHAAASELIGAPMALGRAHRLPATIEALRAALGGAPYETAALLDGTAALLDGASGPQANRARSLRELLTGEPHRIPTASPGMYERFTAAGPGADRSAAALVVGVSLLGQDTAAAARWLELAQCEAAAHAGLADELEGCGHPGDAAHESRPARGRPGPRARVRRSGRGGRPGAVGGHVQDARGAEPVPRPGRPRRCHRLALPRAGHIGPHRRAGPGHRRAGGRAGRHGVGAPQPDRAAGLDRTAGAGGAAAGERGHARVGCRATRLDHRQPPGHDPSRSRGSPTGCPRVPGVGRHARHVALGRVRARSGAHRAGSPGRTGGRGRS